MSTSVYRAPARNLSNSAMERVSFCASELKKVKRVLFEPVDHQATQKFVDEELAKIRKYESEKWNFDFISEQTLDPKGVFEWRPVFEGHNRCIRPVKRRPSEDSFLDMEEMYPDPMQDFSVPLLKPKAIKLDQVKSNHERNQQRGQQSLITDFMAVKKRSTSSDTNAKKKLEMNVERPSKVPRMAEFSI